MRKIRFLIKLLTHSTLFSLICIGIILMTSYLLGPPPIPSDSRTVIFDNSGKMIELHHLHHWVPLREISPYLIDATILAEDKYYYDHHGFDYKGIVRAILKNIRSSRLKEGASTISQQYARNLYLTHEKTWARKIKEAFYTIRLEMFYTKEDILTGYLNSIYYGHGAYGIEAASNAYFHKSAHELTLAEATMLAGIPKGPTYYSPFNNEENAFTRQHFILKRLLDERIITEAEFHTAKNEQLQFIEPNQTTDSFANFFTDVVWKEAEEILNKDKETIMDGGYHIYTTLDSKLQKSMEDIVLQNMDEKSDIEVGVISLQPESGAIISLIGGKAYHISSFNRAIDAKRMVGSTFKPFLYYAALEQGYTPTTMLLSEPTAFVTNDGDLYEPNNYNGYYAYKPISLAQAMALSDNIYAVKTNLFLSPELVINTTRKFGITSDLPSVPSLALGSASISLLEMVRGYGIIANGGKQIESYTIEKIENSLGNVIYERQQRSINQQLDQNKAFVLTHLMTGMFDRRLNGYMEVTGSSIIDQLSYAYAGKSGTTESDSWMIGFSPKIVTGVWTGYDNNKPIHKMSEKTIAKNVWAQIMERAHDQLTTIEFDVPNGVVKKVIDIETGHLATNDCKVTRATYFEKGTEPTHFCNIHLSNGHDKSQNDEITPLYQKLLELFR